MLLGVIPVLFWDFGMILEKNRKSTKTGKSGHFQAPTPQRRERMPQRRPTLRHGIPSPRRRPTQQRSSATPWRRYCSHREIFKYLFRTPHIRTPIV